ncbi:putative S-adenosyl-L-methionine-dependent methyltransferase [Seiridium cardinale]
MSLSDVIGSIESLLGKEAQTAFDEDERKQAIAACGRLKDRLENPFEKTLQLLFTTHNTMGLRLAVDMGVFDAAARLCADAKAVSLADLASETKVDELLLLRVMRVLVGLNVFAEPCVGSYEPLPLAAAYTSKSPLSSAVIHVSHFYTILAQLPEYFGEKGWKNPGDVYDGPFQFAMHTKEHYFDFLAKTPYYQKAFNEVMTLAYRRKGNNWFTFYPVAEKLQVKDDSEVLLVDVGGSQGGDIIAFHEAHPEQAGRLVLQDLPGVIANCQGLPAKVEATGYDFFQEQPVKGAKAYFLRTVLHDWPDKQALEILARLREAMSPESLLLINETIVPDSNVPLSAVQADFTMMVSFASHERTLRQFEELLDLAGFKLLRLWKPEGSEAGSSNIAEQAGLLEAKLK